MPAQKNIRRRGGSGGKDVVATEDSRAVSRAERTAVFGKTKLCKFFIMGCCTKGKDCCFAHAQTEMNPSPDLSRTKICKTLINTGTCTNPDCKYAHNKEELRDMPSAEPFQQELASKQQQKAPAESLQRQSAQPSGQLNKQQQKVAPTQNSAPQDHAQAMLRQQQVFQMMMASPQGLQMMSQMMLAQQQTDVGKAVPNATQSQNPGTAASQPFLYNALFQQGLQQSSQLGNDKSPTKDNAKISMETPPRRKEVQSSNVKCSCGNKVMLSAKFCSACGKPRQANASMKMYDVKNTFVEVEDPIVAAAKKAGVRTWQSATELNMYCDDSPLHSLQQEAVDAETVEDGALKASPQALTAAFAPTFSRMPRVNTWASDLEKVDEESPREDFDINPMANTDEENSPSEKRLQDTPFADENANLNEQIAAAYMAVPQKGLPSMDGVGGVTVKNTFLEFRAEPPKTGMRMVQTASGRLDLLAMGGD
jgi:hypothetical protein